MLLFRLVALSGVLLAVTPNVGGDPARSDPPKRPQPKPYKPNSKFLNANGTALGYVLEVSEEVIVLKRKPTLSRTSHPCGAKVVGKDGEMFLCEETIPAGPVTYHVHPVMKNGGLMTTVCESKSYRVTDVEVGDLVMLAIDQDEVNWVGVIEIIERPGGKLPPHPRGYIEYLRMEDPEFPAIYARKLKYDAQKALEAAIPDRILPAKK